MMLLLLFTYCTLFVTCALGYHTNSGNYPRNDHGLLEQLFKENQDEPVFSRPPRQNRFFSSPGNNFNQFSGFGNSPNNGGFDWYGSGNNFNRNTQRPSRQSDNIIFLDDDDDFNDVVVPNRPAPTTQRTPGSTIAIPGMQTTRSACEDTCQGTMQFDPVCGDNDVTYTNIYWLRCAQRCGRNVNIKHTGACKRVA